MGVIRSKIGFQREPPDPETILQKARVLSGLDIIYDHELGYFTYSDNVVKINKRVKIINQLKTVEYSNDLNLKEVYLDTYVSSGRKRFYLYCVLVASLIDLGGDIDWNIPRWSRIAWNDLKWWHFVKQ